MYGCMYVCNVYMYVMYVMYGCILIYQFKADC